MPRTLYTHARACANACSRHTALQAAWGRKSREDERDDARARLALHLRVWRPTRSFDGPASVAVVRLETAPSLRHPGTATVQPWSLGAGMRCSAPLIRSAPSFSGALRLRLKTRLLRLSAMTLVQLRTEGAAGRRVCGMPCPGGT